MMYRCVPVLAVLLSPADVGNWAVQRCLEAATGPDELRKIVACMRCVLFPLPSPASLPFPLHLSLSVVPPLPLPLPARDTH